MSSVKRYKCSICGQEHEEWPALTYSSPTKYHNLSEEDKINLAEIDSDFCKIRHDDKVDRFIRCTLTQRVIDHCDGLDYGLWVSLSEKSFEDYLKNFNNVNHETGYFGWLSNNLPDYHFEESIPMNVFTRTGNQRPEIVPHENHDHPFVKDYYNGITKSEAERRIKEMLELVAKNHTI